MLAYNFPMMIQHNYFLKQPRRLKQNGRPFMVAVLTAALSIGIPAYSAHHSPAQERDPGPIKKTIEPGKIHEECVLVRENHRLLYTFHASADIEYNLHYHSAQQSSVIYLFGPAQVNTNPEKNLYTAPESTVVCLMWNNTRRETILLDYSFTLTDVSG